MICISVTSESRKFGKVDMLNASPRCDMIELCLDHLVKEPDVGDLLQSVDKPVLVSCRRERDGGRWNGSEEDRLALLRQAIVAGPAYVELELDIANKVPRFGETKRVISYTSLDKPLGNVEKVFQQAAGANADVVKFTWPTPNLDGAWPLLVAVSKKREIPVVGMGLGRASVMFSLLGRKYGSPWIYAALEQGMEAHQGQATVWQLDEIYRWREIDKNTRFIGVVGATETEMTTIRVLNDAFDHHGINSRALPLVLGKLDKLEKMFDILRINTLVLNADTGVRLFNFAGEKEEAAEKAGFADLLLKQPDGWHAYNMIWRSTIKAIEKLLGSESGEERPLDRRSIMLAGSDGISRAIAYGLSQRKGMKSVTAPNDTDGQRMAQQFDMRHAMYANLYDTFADVIIVADPTVEVGTSKVHFNPGYLREKMVAADVTNLPRETEILREARERGCRVVAAKDIYTQQISAIFKAVSGEEFPAELVDQALAAEA